MTLPPLRNLLAIRTPAGADPMSYPSTTAGRLRRSGFFDTVWNPAPGWTAASIELVGGPARQHAIHPADAGPAIPSAAFAEGEDLVLAVDGPAMRRVDHALEAPKRRLSSLPGDFGFLRWSDDGGVTLVRSCGGLVPFYLAVADGVAAIATRMDLLVRFVLPEPEIDRMTLGLWLFGWALFPDGRTVLDRVTVVPRGHVVHWPAAEQPRPPICYWDPRPDALPSVPQRGAEHPRRLRTLLLDQLQRDLDPDGINLIGLSGGVDSSSLAAVAAGTLGRRVSSVSIVPPDPHERAHELSYIRPLVDRLGITDARTIILDDDQLMALPETTPEVAVPVTHPILCSLPKLLDDRPATVMFGGEFADEVCGSRFTWPDWLTHTGLRWALAHPRRMPFQPRNLAHLAAHRLGVYARGPTDVFPGELSSLLHPDVLEEYGEWRARSRATRNADRRPLAHLASRCELDGFMAVNWEVTSVCGVRRCVPFFTRAALGLAFDCHPAELIGPGTKRLLRTALQHDVPAHNLYRSDKGSWAWQRRVAPAREEVRDRFAGVMRDDLAAQPDLGPLDRFALRQLALYGPRLDQLRAGARVAAEHA